MRPFTGAVAALALALVFAGCAGDDEEAAPPAAPRTPSMPVKPVPPPPLPQATVVLVDGDTGKPVRGARVSAAGQRMTSDRAGHAVFGVERRRVEVSVSARGYGKHTERVNFRRRLEKKVELWRPALQWPVFGATPARTQAHPAMRVRPPFRIAWSRRLYGLLEYPAVVWNGVAYVNNIHGTVRALSMRSGRVLWRKRVGTLMASSPAVDPERNALVVTTMSPGDVKVLSLTTGHVRWRYRTGLTEPSPVIRGDIAYFGATNGNVYALDLDRRRARWIYRGGVKITSSPALVRKRLYFGDYAGRVVALDARSGRVRWRSSAGGRVYGTVAVAGGRVFAPSVFSGLSAFSAKSGRLLWRIPSSGYMYSAPAAYRGRVYFGMYGGYVVAANARSGRILWRRSAGGRVSGAVQVVSGLVYAAVLEGRIIAWGWRTGRQAWAFPAGKYVPVSGSGRRLLIHGYGRIWAVDSRRRR